MSSSADILKKIKDEEIEYLDLRFTDPRGKLQHVSILGDGVDEDCDGLVDDEDDSATGKLEYSPDADGDEYGDPIKPDGSYAGKLNVDKNPKDEKITRSEGYVVEAKDLTGNFDKGKKPIKVNLKDLVNKAKNNPKNKNLGVKPPTDTEEVTEAIKVVR